MKTLLTSTILLIFTVTALCVPLPEGWNAAHWGMSASDIMLLYPTVKQAPKVETYRIGGRDYLSSLSLPNIAIVDERFTADFLMGSSGILVGVQLYSSRDTPEKIHAIYEKIKMALVQKYSTPITEGEAEPDGRTLDKSSKQVRWENAGSRLSLEYSASADSPDAPYIIIRYLKLDPTQSATKDANL